MKKTLVNHIRHLLINGKILMLIILLISGTYIPIDAQSKSVTIQTGNTTLKQVINEIEKQTNYLFVYDNTDIDTNQAVHVKVKNEKIEKILNNILKDTDIAYTVENRNILLMKKSESKKVNFDQPVRLAKGTVKDANGEPLIGVTVLEKGTQNGSVTDLEGEFSIGIKNGRGMLSFSYLGFASVEKSADINTPMSIVLQEDVKALDEIVIVGYTAQKKGLLTGAISTMSVSEGIKTLPTTSAGNMLVGKLSGVDVSTPNSVPGSNPSISIRTRSSWNNNQKVLFVIDGIVRSEGDFNNLSVNEIQDVTVLKDAASAAIYGSRSAGGVIVVTTKKGKTGKPIFNYSYGYSVDSRTANQEFTTAYETYDMFNKINGNSGTADFWGQDELDYLKTVNGGYGYDHLDAVYRSPTTQSHNLSVDGGNDKLHYFAAGSFVKQEGIFKQINYNKYNIRMNVTANITNDLEAFVGISLVDTKRDMIDGDYGEGGVYQTLISDDPGYPMYTEGGKIIGRGKSWNPVGRIDGSSGYNTTDYLNPQLTASMTYKMPFLKGMSAKVLYGQSWSNAFNKRYFAQYDMVKTKTSGTNGHIISTNDDDITEVYKATWPDKSSLKRDSNKKGNQQLNLQLTFDRTFGEHHVNAALVSEWSESTSISVYGGRENFPVYQTDQFWAASNSRADTWGGGDSDKRNGRMSYIGQFTYAYANKYLASFSFREDGSMNFAPGKRWGFFPAASAGWVISEENFFNRSFVDFLKLRASVGLTGNDGVGGWQWQYSFKQGNSAYYGQTPIRYTGIKYGDVVNPNLTWEKSLSWNIGADLNFAKNWNVSLDYWYRNTYDILGNRQATLPSTFSMSMPDENYGKVKAQGFDFSLGYQGASKDFSYFAKLNMSYGWNKVVEQAYPEDAQYVDIPVGKSTNYIKGFVYDGIIKTQEQLDEFNAANPDYRIGGTPPALGQMIYKDISGPNGVPDGIIDDWDRTVLYKNNFPVIYGLNLGGSWKGFSIDAMFSGKLGDHKSFRDLAEGAEWNRMWKEWYGNSWTEENPDAWLPKRQPYGNWGEKTYDKDNKFWYKTTNFVRLKYLTVSYTLPKTLTKNVLENVRFYCTGTNLFVLSNYKYYDPEIGNGKMFPITRSFSFGVDVKF